MPIPLVAEVLDGGLAKIPYAYTILKTIPWIVLIYLLKLYFGGTSNRSERVLHSKVIMMTGGTSGIGAAIARELASRGAQLILLTQHALNDPFLVEYIEDLREATNNQLITAEQVDLSSLYSIRVFATKWVDNAPPRRLDMVILCANTMTPSGGRLTATEDGLESNWGVNYVANFHLLSILSPAIRAQPPDRDVRIIFGMCASYMGGDLHAILPAAAEAPAQDGTAKSKSKAQKAAAVSQPATLTVTKPKPMTPSLAYATSKLALLTFAHAFQAHLSAYARPDKEAPNAHVVVVDPGWTRTPGMRRYLSFGSLAGLLLYLVLYPLWWLVLKGPERGAQGFLFAAMEAGLGRANAPCAFVKECVVRDVLRNEVKDENVQKKLWEESEKTVTRLEKESAVKRALAKKEDEAEKEKKAKASAEKANAAAGKESMKVNGGNSSKAQTPGSRRSKEVATGS